MLRRLAAWLRHPVARYLGATGVMALGSVGMFALLITMNHLDLGGPEEVEKAVVQIDPAPKKKKPPPKKKSRPKPKPRPSKAPPPPTPSLGASLAGMSFGLPQFGGDLLGGAEESLLGQRGDVVMTEDAVDDPPTPARRTPVSYPKRALAKNISGFVTFSLVVKSDGSIQDLRILESEPPGVFEEAATECIRGWSFNPATYEGEPVAVRVRQTIRFVLE